MNADVEKLIRKGRTEPFAALLEQARVTYERAKRHLARLEARGYRQEQLDDFAVWIEKASTFAGGAEAKREASKSLTRAEGEAVTRAKGFIRDLNLAAPLAIRASGTKELTPESFYANDRLNRSSRKIVLYLDRIAEHVTRLEESFKPYLGVESPAAHLASLKKALLDANALQELALGDLPQATRQYFEAKGRLLQHIEDVNRIAKIAFAGEAEIAGTFNKDVLLRGRSRRDEELPGGGEPQSG